jgi:nicotinate-nucleotide adenylyltransferase
MSDAARRIGILGGTFDPVHIGHVDVGRAAVAALRLDRLIMVPSSTPPHRQPPQASGWHRFAMTAMAIEACAGWTVSDIELRAGALSYTATTLAALHAEGFRADELYFVIGADAFGEIGSWKDYPQILSQAHFAVVSRPGAPAAALRGRLPALADRMQAAPFTHSTQAPAIILIDAPTADVSSTEIRARLAAGRSVAGLIDPRVQQHIERHGLYASAAARDDAHAASSPSTAGRLHGQD